MADDKPLANHQGLLAEQVRSLDSLYFEQCPASYFDARFWAIIRLADMSNNEGIRRLEDEGSLIARIGALMPEARFVENPVDDSSDRLRAAILDALSLRSHVAETVVILFRALSQALPDSSIWFSMASNHRAGEMSEWAAKQLAKRNSREWINGELGRLVFHGDPDFVGRADDADDPRLAAATAWVSHFMDLVRGQTGSGSTAYNQLKHGLGVFVREDIRVDFVSQIADPNRPTVSELNESIPIINKSSIRYLQRHRPDRGHDFGWGLVLANADPATILVESFWGCRLLELLWKTAKFSRFASAEPGPQQVNWTTVHPEEVLGRSGGSGVSLMTHVLAPQPKRRP